LREREKERRKKEYKLTPEMDQVTRVEVSHRRHDLAGKGATKKTRELHVGGSCFIGPITTTSSSPCGLFIPIKRELHPIASTPTKIQNKKTHI
jgi:hypothetical protein